ncbi:MAG: NADH-quinone oxidoreductase subunit NuoK [Vampirovibrionales bacterium]|nr:NADH-quinone oxidoreductase subunit NuoK [Vampirovibrionales bacterium]
MYPLLNQMQQSSPLAIGDGVTLAHFLVLATVIFCIGLYGVLTGRNVIRVLICVELMMNAVNINLVAFNRFVEPTKLEGQIFAIFVLVVSAAEAAVGLAIVIALYRLRSSVNINDYNELKG